MTQPLTLEDRFAIEELCARYAWSLDTGDVDGFGECFTEDAVMMEEVFDDPDEWYGRAQIRKCCEHYKNAEGFPGRQHHIGQLILDGDTEKCSAKSYAIVTECHGNPPFTLRFAGYYEDEIVKIDGRWYFKKRMVRLWEGPALKDFPGQTGVRPQRTRPPELVIKK
jgi:ketosteroid isomerase-like protein